MKNTFRYIALLFFATLLFACDDDSIQQRKDDEKSERLRYIEENNIPDTARLTSGLYFITIKEGSGMSPKDYVVGKHKMNIYYTFYYLDGRVIDHNGLYGKFEPYIFSYGDYSIKPALLEAVGKMKQGGKARLIIPSALNIGSPYIGVELSYTNNEFITVICDIELAKVSETNDPDNDF